MTGSVSARSRLGGLLVSTLATAILLGIVCFASLGLAISSVITSAEPAAGATFAVWRFRWHS